MHAGARGVVCSRCPAVRSTRSLPPGTRRASPGQDHLPRLRSPLWRRSYRASTVREPSVALPVAMVLGRLCPLLTTLDARAAHNFSASRRVEYLRSLSPSNGPAETTQLIAKPDTRRKDLPHDRESQVMSIRMVCRGIAVAALMAATTAVGGEPWPTRAVKVISPFTAGNAADT